MIRAHLRTYWVLLQNAFSYESQYRIDTLVKLFTNLLWVGMMFVIIEIIFSQTASIAGWGKGEVYLMAVFWIMADELYVCLFGENLSNLGLLIVQGDLDAHLVKPISTLFLVSCRIVLLRAIPRFLTQVPILFWVLYRFHFSITVPSALLAVLLIVVAVSIDYSRVLIANTFSFWFLRIDNVNDVIGSLSGLGRYPLTIWPKTVKILLLTAVPVAFSGFMPVATLVGRWPWYGVLYAVVFAVFLFLLAQAFWKFALRRYTSASS